MSETIVLQEGDSALVVRKDGAHELILPKQDMQEQMCASGWAVVVADRMLSSEALFRYVEQDLNRALEQVNREKVGQA